MFLLAFATAFIAAFMQTFAVVIDNLIVCVFFGESEIAAVTLAGPFFYLLEIPAAGLALGIQTVCAKELGAGHVDKVNRSFNQLFFFVAVVMSVLMVFILLLAPQMTVLFGARGNTEMLRPLANQYIYGLSFEVVPYVLFCIMAPIVVLDNGGRLVSVASVCGCATDIILDLLSVRFGWGLFGIGIATSVSAMVYFSITILHFAKGDNVIKLKYVRMRFSEIKDVFIASAPKAFLSFADTMRSLLLISLVSITGGVIGTCVLSIHGTITYMVMIVAKGLAGALGIMAGISWGEKNGEELAGNIILVRRYIIVLSLCVVVLLSVFARPLSTALTDSREAAELLTFAIYCICFTAPFAFMLQSRISLLQASEHIREAQWLGITANLIVLAIAAVLLVIPFGVRGVFMAFSTSQIVTLLASNVVLRKRIWKGLSSESEFSQAKDSLYVKPQNVISYPLETTEDCSLASEQVMLFCRGHGLDERKGLLAGLCVEELTTNVIEHGIKPHQDIEAADLRVVIDGETVIIRLRDDGEEFNLKTLVDRMRLQEETKAGTGIKLLLSSAESVSYYRIYGMNTTIIKV